MLLLCSKSSNVSFAQIKSPNHCHSLQSLIRSGCPPPPPPLSVLIFYNSLQSVMADSLNPANMLLPHGLSTSVPLCVTLYPAYPPSSYSYGDQMSIYQQVLYWLLYLQLQTSLSWLFHTSHFSFSYNLSLSYIIYLFNLFIGLPQIKCRSSMRAVNLFHFHAWQILVAQ